MLNIEKMTVGKPSDGQKVGSRAAMEFNFCARVRMVPTMTDCERCGYAEEADATPGRI